MRRAWAKLALVPLLPIIFSTEPTSMDKPTKFGGTGFEPAIRSPTVTVTLAPVASAAGIAVPRMQRSSRRAIFVRVDRAADPTLYLVEHL